MAGPEARAILADAGKCLGSVRWERASIEEAVKAVADRHGMKVGKAQAPIRVAITGRTKGLPLFESLVVLGRERSLARVDAALARIDAAPPVG